MELDQQATAETFVLSKTLVHSCQQADATGRGTPSISVKQQTGEAWCRQRLNRPWGRLSLPTAHMLHCLPIGAAQRQWHGLPANWPHQRDGHETELDSVPISWETVKDRNPKSLAQGGTRESAPKFLQAMWAQGCCSCFTSFPELAFTSSQIS